MDKISGIYKITNILNNKAYIGLSVDIEQRIKTHKLNGKKMNEDFEEYDKALYKSMRKYGLSNFKFEVIEQVDNIADLNEKEIY